MKNLLCIILKLIKPTKVEDQPIKPNITNNLIKFVLYYLASDNTFAVGIICNKELITMSEPQKFTKKKYEFCNNALKKIFSDNVDIYPEIILENTQTFIEDEQ